MLTAVTVSSRGKLARHLGVSVTMVGNYVDQGMPVQPDGTYDVEECLAWQAAMRASSGRPTKGDDGDNELDLRERKLKAECEKLEQETIAKRMKNDLLAGDLVRADEQIAEWAEFLASAKAIIESFADDFAKEAPEELRVSARALADHKVTLLLRKLASWTPKESDENDAADTGAESP